MVNAEVTSDGAMSFEGQIVGRLQGFRFTPETGGDTEAVKPDNADIASALALEFDVRANRLSEAVDSALVLANDGAIRWLGDPIAKIAAGEKLLTPRALILADEALTETAKEKVQTRVDLWLAAYVHRLLGPLFELEAGVGLEGPARNVATQLVEALGVLERGRVAHDVKALDQSARGLLRKLGVRFGAHYVYAPNLVKPAIRVLATQLWALRQHAATAGAGLDEIPQLAASGRTSFLADSAISKETYRVAGFRLCGDRAVRVDIVERLADLIRPAIVYRPGPNAGPPPQGAADGDGFVVTGAMTSLTGCSGEQFASVLRSLGFVSERIKGPALTIPSAPPEAVVSENAPPVAPEDESAAVQSEEAAEASAEIESDAQEAMDGAASPPVASEETPPEAPAAEDNREQAAVEESAPVGDAEAAEVSAVAEPAAELAATAGEQTETPNEAEPAEAAAPEAAAVEEPLIEVWRPKPPNRQHRHPRPREAVARPKEAAEGESQQGRREGASERFRHRRRPATVAAPPTGGEAEAAPKEENAGAQSRRGGRRHFDAPNKAEGGGRRFDQKNGRASDERRQDERKRENAPPPAPRREAPVNLNSPFAKLLALKSQLEAKGKG
jgi:ATP-dependent RNA helicase SUPV3L1/SUV3